MVGKDVYAFGGRGDNDVLHRHDTLVLDTSTGEATETQPLPFTERPIHIAALASTESAIVVAAVLCSEPRAGADGLECAGTNVQTAVLDLSRNRWSPPSPLGQDTVTAATQPDSVFPIVELGIASGSPGQVYLTYRDVDRAVATTFVSEDASAGRWSKRGAIRPDAQVCISGSGTSYALSASYGESPPVVVGADPPPSLSLEFSPDGEQWTPVADPFGTENVPGIPLLVCDDRGAVMTRAAPTGGMTVTRAEPQPSTRSVKDFGSPAVLVGTGSAVVAIDASGRVLVEEIDGSEWRTTIPSGVPVSAAYDPTSHVLAVVLGRSGPPDASVAEPTLLTYTKVGQ